MLLQEMGSLVSLKRDDLNKSRQIYSVSVPINVLIRKQGKAYLQ